MNHGRYLAAVVLAALIGLLTPESPAQVNTSDTCGTCHKDIYWMWRQSAHANAMEDPIFLEVFRETQKRDGPAVSKTCLRCHAPMIDINNDVKLEKKITWEGVSCDVCHSLVAVELTDRGPKQIFDVGDVKRGPIKDAQSMAHKVAWSELHSTSLVCAGCHEYVNADGTQIMGTYSEWKASKAAKKGKTCQTCHMGKVKADVVDPRVKRVAQAEVNLHEVPGGHSIDQLHKALDVLIMPTTRTGDELSLEVVLANTGAGHSVPTGMPGRRVILEVKVATSKGQIMEEQRVYGTVYKTAAGAVIDRDADYFAAGVVPVSDTRIKADEERSESFRFRVPATDTAYVTIKLQYEHAPRGGPEGRTFLTFHSETRTIRPEKRS